MSKLAKNIHNISLIFKESSLPRLETEILISFLLGKRREFLMTHPETSISLAIYKKFKELEKKRLKNWPIAYLIGSKEFYGLNFKVTPAVLMPRPETEMIVDEIIEMVKGRTNNVSEQRAIPHIIDLGTGSGAIISATGSEIRRLFPIQFKNIKLSAVDISATALKIAKQNAKTHELNSKIKFYHGSLLAPLKLETKKLTRQTLIIAANLPYLTPAQIKKSPSISREPRLALDGGRDGLKYYRQLFQELSSVLKKQNFSFRILCEIDPGQSRPIIMLAKKILPQAQAVIKKDLAKKNRLVIINSIN